jgi:hypothetical protein
MQGENKLVVIDSTARETSLTVNGKNYLLRYSFEAIAGFEEGTGINPAIQTIPPTTQNLMFLLFAGLRAHHPEISIETVASWFNEESAGALCKVAWESFYGTLPEPEKKTTADESPNPPSA